jgi:hypothetical protein
MGFTGNVVQEGPMPLGTRAAGFRSLSCVYRQWIFDPTAAGVVRDYQVNLAKARTEKWIKETYAASLRNAANTASGFYAITPIPWLKRYPTTPFPGIFSTVTTEEAPAGSLRLKVADTTGFLVGTSIRIGENYQSAPEVNTVAGLGAGIFLQTDQFPGPIITLATPLKFSHPAQTPIIVAFNAGAPAPGPAPGPGGAGVHTTPMIMYTPPPTWFPPTTTLPGFLTSTHYNPYLTTTYNPYATTTGAYGVTTTGYR